MTKSLALLCVLLISGVQFIDAYVWCCTSKAELKKCNSFRSRTEHGRPVFDFECLYADGGTDECMQHIRAGHADIIDLDGGDIYHYQDDITIVAAENSGYEDASYFAIAVVKKGADPNLSLTNLAGYRTCHTGVGKTSGWNMPMGWLLRNGQDPSQISASCAPGAKLSTYAGMIPGGPAAKWCEQCIGDSNGENVCDRDSDERYYGYHGAFKCMIDGKGDVAFIKQTIIKDEEADAYELLCPDAPRRASPRDWDSCHLGRVPAHAVVMRKGVSAEDAASVYGKLVYAWNKLGDRNSYGKGKNILWGSKVKYFMYMNRMNPVKYMGDNYVCNLSILRNDGRATNC